MFFLLSAEYKKKYARKRDWDVMLFHFSAKLLGPLLLFFLVAVGMDVYRLLH